MKILLFASALALGSAAIAQDMTPPPAPPADQMAPAPTTPPDATPPAAPAAAPADTATPMPPAPASDKGAMPEAQSQASSTDDSNLPACSRTVTDKCVQKGGAGHHAMKHAKKHHAAPKKK